MEYKPEQLSKSVEFSHYFNVMKLIDRQKKYLPPVFPFNQKVLQKKHRILSDLGKISRLRVILNLGRNDEK